VHHVGNYCMVKYFLERYVVEGHGFLNILVTGNKIWSYHVDPEESSKNTKPKTKPSAKQDHQNGFWDVGGNILP